MKINVIFLISMVELVGIDVYIVIFNMMKFYITLFMFQGEMLDILLSIYSSI